MPKPIILLVEDDIALLEGMADTLDMKGYKTIKATNGREGLDVLQQVCPDLIISDIMMPEMDGHEFHKEVLSHPEHATIPFIFLTARSNQADVRRGLREGVDAYLTKPFDLEDLLIQVQNKLRRFAALRKQTMAQLEELQRQIVTMFSHELRTPLTYIQGYTDLLADSRQDSASTDEMKMFLDGIRVGSHRLHNLVEDLLVILQLDTNTYTQEFARFAVVRPDLEQLVRTVARSFEPAAAEKGLSIRVEIAASLPAVRLVSEHIIKALGNLLSNAIKFTQSPGAQILLCAYPAGEWVCIDVVDEGIGIEARHLPYIFERFRQMNREKYEQAGMGVGLAIARGFIQVHGGDIEVKSTPGKGSTFSIYLPVVQSMEG